MLLAQVNSALLFTIAGIGDPQTVSLSLVDSDCVVVVARSETRSFGTPHPCLVGCFTNISSIALRVDRSSL